MEEISKMTLLDPTSWAVTHCGLRLVKWLWVWCPRLLYGLFFCPQYKFSPHFSTGGTYSLAFPAMLPPKHQLQPATPTAGEYRQSDFLALKLCCATRLRWQFLFCCSVEYIFKGESPPRCLPFLVVVTQWLDIRMYLQVNFLLMMILPALKLIRRRVHVPRVSAWS